MGFELKGMDELIEKFKDAEEPFSRAIGEVVNEMADAVFTETQVRVPKGDTGALQGSGHVDPVDTSGMKRSCNIHYGDSDVDRVGVFYAAAVHELLSHEHPPPTGAKYVEGPLIAAIPEFREKLARKMEDTAKEHFK